MDTIRIEWLPKTPEDVVIYYKGDAYLVFRNTVQLYTGEYVIVLGGGIFECYHKDNINRHYDAPDHITLDQCREKIRDLYTNICDSQLFVDPSMYHEQIFALLDN